LFFPGGFPIVWTLGYFTTLVGDFTTLVSQLFHPLRLSVVISPVLVGYFTAFPFSLAGMPYRL